MLIYPICVAFDIDGHGEMIAVGVNWYFQEMIISNGTVYGPETADSKTYLRFCKFLESKGIK